jgi:hypothetical protein
VPKLKDKQKGLIGETIYLHPSRVNPNFHPKLFNFLLNYLSQNYSKEVGSAEIIDLEIIGKDDTYKKERRSYSSKLKWNYHKKDTEDQDSFSNNPAWRPDAIVIAEIGTLHQNEELLQFPLEIKTGKDGRIYHEQREAFIHVAENTEVLPLFVTVDITDLPDKYTTELRKWNKEKEQIRLIEDSKLAEPSQEISQKRIAISSGDRMAIEGKD